MIDLTTAKEINSLVDIVQKYHPELSLMEMVSYVLSFIHD